MDDETPALDPKPWSCVNCSDRFARSQTEKSIHWTNFTPRPQYSQNREDYS